MLQKSKIKNISDINCELIITISSKSIEKEANKIYLQLSKTVNIDGFRKGKIPKEILIKKYSLQIERDVLKKLLSLSYKKAILEHNLIVVSRPIIKNLSKYEIKKDFIYSAKFEIKPKLISVVYKKLKILINKNIITKRLIEKEVQKLREENSIIKKINNNKISHGHIVEFDCDGFIDNIKNNHISGNNLIINIGSMQNMKIIEKSIIGKKIKETIKIKIKLDKNFYEKNMIGKNAILHIKILNISKKILPEFNENFFKKISKDLNNINDLNTMIKNKIKKEIKIEEEWQKKIKIIDKLILNNQFNVPKTMIKSQSQKIFIDISKKINNSHSNIKHFDNLSEIMKNQIKIKAKKDIKLMIILENIAKKEKISLSRNELNNIQLNINNEKDKEKCKNMEYCMIQEKALDLVSKESLMEYTTK